MNHTNSQDSDEASLPHDMLLLDPDYQSHDESDQEHQRSGGRSSALHSYFSLLAIDHHGDTGCENVTVVVDNAHIPLSEALLAVSRPMATFSRSLSALNTMSFPPPFLHETSRWDLVEEQNSSTSDVSLHVPSRSRDDDLFYSTSPSGTRNAMGHRSFPLGPTSSLDSTVRWLRKLPFEGVANNPDASPSGRRRQRQPPLCPQRCPEDQAQEELPLLQKPYQELESYPRAGEKRLRRLSEGSIETCEAVAPNNEDEIPETEKEVAVESTEEDNYGHAASDLAYDISQDGDHAHEVDVDGGKPKAPDYSGKSSSHKGALAGEMSLRKALASRGLSPPPVQCLMEGYQLTTSPFATLQLDSPMKGSGDNDTVEHILESTGRLLADCAS